MQYILRCGVITSVFKIEKIILSEKSAKAEPPLNILIWAWIVLKLPSLYIKTIVASFGHAQARFINYIYLT